MWAEYNYSAYPLVEVNMKGTIKSDEEFDAFITEWKELYDRQTPFVFIFDTREVGWVSMRYAFKMARFIKELKKEKKQWLNMSAIIVNSWWVKILLKLIFKIESPVAPVEYHSSPDTLDIERLHYNSLMNWRTII